MNKQQYLLIKLAEEASEVAQIALKTAQFGLHETYPGQPKSNIDRVLAEVTDLLAILEMLDVELELKISIDREEVEKKMTKVRKYLAISRELGEVHD